MKNWSISFKLLCLVAIAILAFVVMGLYGIANTRSTFRWVEEVNSTAQEFPRSTRDIGDPLHKVRELALSLVLAPDRELQQTLSTAVAENSRQLDAAFASWPVARMDASERAAFEKLRVAWADYHKLAVFTVDRTVKGYREEAFINTIETAARQFEVAIAALENWQKVKVDGAQAVYRAADANFKSVVRTSTLVVVLTVLLVGGVAFFVVRTITGPIGILTVTASRIADNVEDTQAEEALAPVLSGGDEVGQLARGFSRMVAALRAIIQTEIQSRARMDEILGNTRAAVRQLGTTSAQLMGSTKDQSAGAAKQAEAVAAIVTTVEEVTQTAREAATRAAGVGRTVQRTLEIGTAGRQAVDDSVSALSGVRQQLEQTARNITALIDKTKAISEIITTVDDIAQQSHVLAVNAAIEAAKARKGGEQFTVIASEIRAMAVQSRKGTAQIRKILDEVVKASSAAVESMDEVNNRVSGAIKVGDQSSQAINELAVALAEVAKTSEQTIVSADQEALGMAQITEVMRNIDLVAKQALVTIQGTATAARQLNDLGSQLMQLSAEERAHPGPQSDVSSEAARGSRGPFPVPLGPP